MPDALGPRRLNDLVVISGILWVIWHGIPWRQLPEIYGKWNTVYARFRRWSKKGVFHRIFQVLGMKLKKRNIAMLDSTHTKAHRTASSLRYDGHPRLIGRSRGGITTKIHLLCNSERQPLDFSITEGQHSDIKAAPELIASNANRMKFFVADKAYDYDADNLRENLTSLKISACIPPKSNRKFKPHYSQSLYKKRHVIENMFAKLKDWRGVAMRYCRCAHTYTSFVSLALIFTFLVVH